MLRIVRGVRSVRAASGIVSARAWMSSGLSGESGGGGSGGQQLLVALEGSIGSGKSTLLRLAEEGLRERMSVETVAEPVESWKDVRGENLLALFYSDPKRWAYAFQSYAFVSRLMLQASTPSDAELRLMERSAFSDKHIFASNAWETGMMSPTEWAVYNEVWDFYTRVTPGTPHAFVYLRTPAATCFERMRRRARVEEDAVPLEYLEQIHAHHDAWFDAATTLTTLPSGAPVYETADGLPYIVVDGEIEFESEPDNLASIVDSIAQLTSWLRARAPPGK